MMKEFRCQKCRRLLAKIDGTGTRVEIKCPRCKGLNTFSEEIYITIEEEKKLCSGPDIAES
ncbi:Com family DNA-binding transcriptional regulator [Candidatus Saganbacteria bacterium]|nr:Com family DNA-binding transcriptional regulator [Candidatus Saganbacteria bacterium]